MARAERRTARMGVPDKRHATPLRHLRKDAGSWARDSRGHRTHLGERSGEVVNAVEQPGHAEAIGRRRRAKKADALLIRTTLSRTGM